MFFIDGSETENCWVLMWNLEKNKLSYNFENVRIWGGEQQMLLNFLNVFVKFPRSISFNFQFVKKDCKFECGLIIKKNVVQHKIFWICFVVLSLILNHLFKKFCFDCNIFRDLWVKKKKNSYHPLVVTLYV